MILSIVSIVFSLFSLGLSLYFHYQDIKAKREMQKQFDEIQRLIDDLKGFLNY